MTIDEKLDLLLMSFDQLQCSMEGRFERLEERMDSLELKMGRQEERTDGIEQKLVAHIQKYNSDQTLIHASLFRLKSSSKYVLDKQQEHDIASHRLQLQMDKQ
jgi:uncharacterized coiled-coil protein SlyX